MTSLRQVDNIDKDVHVVWVQEHQGQVQATLDVQTSYTLLPTKGGSHNVIHKGL